MATDPTRTDVVGTEMPAAGRRVFKVEGLDAEREAAVRSWLLDHFKDEVRFAVDRAAGTVTVSGGADPQVVVFLLDDAGVRTTAVEG